MWLGNTAQARLPQANHLVPQGSAEGKIFLVEEPQPILSNPTREDEEAGKETAHVGRSAVEEIAYSFRSAM
ncbi:hypothetical protein E2C01_037292 [Portunus trituberculatus]|uniref:Uncharacterized protein n=1 Tax=Portunus trituberculatus TaxID=210409 RepID=A0A5B7F7R5_PORTR|nr:hypothetical protein [Portunus trituberculatus]